MRLIKLVRTGISDLFNDVEIIYQEIPKEDQNKRRRKKLIEEALEYYDDPSIDELADVYEVIRSLAKCDLEISMKDVVKRADEKSEERGSFNEGIGMYLRKR